MPYSIDKAHRTAFTDKERQELRLHYSQHPKKTQKELINWFYQQFGRWISQSSISDCISSQYKHLDSKRFKRGEEGPSRSRAPHWPALDDALYQVHQRLERRCEVITGDILRKAASRLWQSLPQFAGLKEPSWSTGWLQGFQKRRGIRFNKQHGEAGSVPLEAEKAMIAIRWLLQQYPYAADVYNMDETGLFWKHTPDGSLTTERLAGRKKEKVRLTSIHCTNGDGSDLMPLWIVGKAAKPRAFGSNNRNIQGLPINYRSNTKAWVTGPIACEWLQWFAQRTKGRQVVLLWDNHSAHEVAVKELAQTEALSHVRIVFLPANSTSRFQPCDQGIIACYKAAYRRFYLEYLVDRALANESGDINLLQAVRWASVAWSSFYIHSQTVANCFRHSTVFSEAAGPALAPTNYSHEQELANRLVQLRVIKQPMAIETFLNPPDEDAEDPSDQDPVQYVIDQHIVDQDDQLEQEVPDQPPIAAAEAIKALELLISHEEQQLDASNDLIYLLTRHERVLRQRKLHSGSQGSITSYFMPV